MTDMKVLLHSLCSPPEVSIHLTTARWRFIPSARNEGRYGCTIGSGSPRKAGAAA
jgi:hypothetical protein